MLSFIIHISIYWTQFFLHLSACHWLYIRLIDHQKWLCPDLLQKLQRLHVQINVNNFLGIKGSRILSNKIHSLARSSFMVSQKTKDINFPSQSVNAGFFVFFSLFTVSCVPVASKWTRWVTTVVQISGPHRENTKSIVWLICF